MSLAETQAKRLRGASFLISAAAPKQFPEPSCPEIAFAGRSNAGKSSTLNALCAQTNLARTSKTPGRTQLINFFDVPNAAPGALDANDDDFDGAARLVDLPGYGFAKAPPAARMEWQKLIDRYLAERESLAGLVLIVDIRHALTDFDAQMLDWCAAAKLPALVLLNKSDKLSRGAAGNIKLKVIKELPLRAQVETFSARTGDGLDRARGAVLELLFPSRVPD